VRLTPEQADAVLAAPEGAQVNNMAHYSAVGTPDEVLDYLDWFTGHAGADELIVVSSAPDRAAWLRSLELLAKAAL
jgi:alkanesulfonate monooxygenase SsuD/methylene tetrahydromethanopterin reductase-like flavin-dependent oxidoreductase (luciferase family)